VRKADNLPPSCAVVTKSGNLNFLEPSGPVQACNGTALPLPLPIVNINLYAPCILYIGQTYHYTPEYAFYIFSQQIYLIIFSDFLAPSSFIPPQNVVYFPMLPFLVHKIITFYINGVLNCKCPAPGPKG